MGTLYFNLAGFCSLISSPGHHSRTQQFLKPSSPTILQSIRGKRIRSLEVERVVPPTSEPETSIATPTEEEPPSIDFAFVNSRLLPDSSPDIQLRSARGGQKLRDIMLDSNIDLYGPYARPLLNCGGGGTCATCIVEVVEGKELLNLRTDKEKEALKKKPKTWRLACQTMVGERGSRGQVVIQQLPEWKAHEWKNK